MIFKISQPYLLGKKFAVVSLLSEMVNFFVTWFALKLKGMAKRNKNIWDISFYMMNIKKNGQSKEGD